MKFFFNLLLMLIFSSPLWSQNGTSSNTIEITYIKAFKHSKDTTNIAPKIFKNIEYQLLCNTNEARFEYISSMSIDGDRTNIRYIGKGGGKGIFYKNLKEHVSLCLTNFEEDFLVEEKFNKYQWELKKETKKILGYDCFKAIGSYEEYSYFFKENRTITVEAWYAPSLPLPFGPSGFDGLPGLVLESVRGGFHITAKNILFHDKQLKIKRPTKGKKVSREEFLKTLRNIRLNMEAKN